MWKGPTISVWWQLLLKWYLWFNSLCIKGQFLSILLILIIFISSFLRSRISRIIHHNFNSNPLPWVAIEPYVEWILVLKNLININFKWAPGKCYTVSQMRWNSLFESETDSTDPVIVMLSWYTAEYLLIWLKINSSKFIGHRTMA